MAFGRAHLDGDFETTASSPVRRHWLRGADSKIRIPGYYLQKARPGQNPVSPASELHPIGKGTVHDAMRGLLWAVFMWQATPAWFSASMRWKNSLSWEIESVRIKHFKLSGSMSITPGVTVDIRICACILAATPEMFESEHYFPRYDALGNPYPIGW